jgi:hypothetical protein
VLGGEPDGVPSVAFVSWLIDLVIPDRRKVEEV